MWKMILYPRDQSSLCVESGQDWRAIHRCGHQSSRVGPNVGGRSVIGGEERAGGRGERKGEEII